MKLKSLLFGSAAVLAAGTGVAQAADLPIVEPVEYVRICDAFGVGFYYIPGTDTCLRVGGYVRVESHFVDGDVGVFYAAPEGDVNNWTTRARGHIDLDARTQTDFGLVRAFIGLEVTVGPGNHVDADADAFDPLFGNDPGLGYGDAPGLAAAFIQVSNDWGTYTAGHAGSFFDFWGSHGWGTRINIDDPTGEQTLFAWTFAGGNGFSFTISAEDPQSGGRRTNGDDDYEGQEAPDGVANIRVDQGWGSAQVMGVVRHVHDYNGAASDDAIAWAVGAGLSLGIPGGWTFDSQAGYSEGAVAYVTSESRGNTAGLGDLDFGPADNLNEAWSVRAGITGPIVSNVTVWLDGSFTHAEEGGGGATDDELDVGTVKAGAAWEPVPGLVMGPEVAFQSFDITDRGAADETPDYDVWGAMWRVQRSF
jgi:hypothetical protein